MSRVKGKNTMPELTLRREIWRRGMRFRIDVTSLPGRPDVVFRKAKVAVFIDGAFWHGKKLTAERLNEMSDYWQKKIKSNVLRDAKANAALQELGYLVLRFLDRDILANPSAAADQIEKVVKARSLTG